MNLTAEGGTLHVHAPCANPRRLACRIAACAGEQGLHYCYECSQFPCALLLPMDKRYWTRYGVSLLENSRTAKEQGLQAFFQAQRARFTCPDCGGVISLHDAQCSECHRPLDEHDFV